MSFDLGPVKRPMIQESQNMQNNGGGGCLGYMSQGGNKEENKDNKENETNFLPKNNDVDTVDIEIKDSEYEQNSEHEIRIKFNPKKLIENITNKIVNKLKPVPSNPFHP